MDEAQILKCCLENGAFKAEAVPVRCYVLSASFRDICRDGGCGNYGRCYMCPPDCGDIDTMMNMVRSYEHSVIFQTVSTLEDSYDFEGMSAAAVHHAALTQKIRRLLLSEGSRDMLVLSCGGCRLCPKCAKLTNEPCRHPEQAITSLECCGIDVYQTTKNTSMKYINGVNTVTYFSAILYDHYEGIAK